MNFISHHAKLRLTRRHVLCLVAANFLLAGCFVWTGEWIHRALQRPLQDQTQHLTQTAPTLSPEIRILWIDGATRKLVDGSDLSLPEWQSLAVALSPARAVIWDRDFSAPLSRDDAEMFSETMGALPIQRMARVWVSLPNQGAPLDVNHSDFLRSDWTQASGRLPVTKRDHIVSGIHSSIRKAFSHLGHFQLEDPYQTVLLQTLDRDHVVAALPLFLESERQLKGTTLRVNQSHLPAFSPIPIRLASRESVEKQTQSLGVLLEALRGGTPLPEISSSDVFLILDGPRTASELSQVQARTRALASVAQSVLSSQWLSSWGNPVLVALSAIGLALILSLWSSPIIGGVLGTIGAVGGGLLLFLFGGVETPWLCASGAFALSCGIGASIQRHGDQKRAARIRGALEGFVSQEELAHLTSHPTPMDIPPTQTIVTVLFIDVVGFSNEIERQSPEVAFSQIRQMHQEITRTVLAHGGIVGKALGDGLLCYFGYHYEGSPPVNHADAAVQCGLALQTANLTRNLQASQNEQPIYPLRIGIQTGTVYVGNVGSGERLEYSILGQTVSTAKLLESACDDYCVMMGGATRDMLSPGLVPHALHPRKVQVKRFQNLLDAFEVDPLEADPQKKTLAVKLHREFLGLERRETRWPVPEGADLHAVHNGERCQVINFSTSGVAIEMPHYIGKGTSLSVTLGSLSGDLEQRLARDRITQISGVVRWGRPTKAGFLHGLEIENLDQKQKLVLIQHLRHCLTGPGTANSTNPVFPLPKKVG